MPYNFAADGFHTKKLCSRLSSSEVRFSMEIGRFAFLRPPLRDLGATYDDHLRLIENRVVDFLLVLIELFSLGVTAEELRANIGWKSAISLQRGPVDSKFQVEGVADISFILSQITRLTDGQTDGRREFSSLDRVCIPCSAVVKSTENDIVTFYRAACDAHAV